MVLKGHEHVLLIGGTFIIVLICVLVKSFYLKGGFLVGSTKFSPFGLCVKKRLLDLGMTQKELEEEVNRRTGLFVDAGYMYKILTGQREAPKISRAVRDILNITECKQDTTK